MACSDLVPPLVFMQNATDVVGACLANWIVGCQQKYSSYNVLMWLLVGNLHLDIIHLCRDHLHQ